MTSRPSPSGDAIRALGHGGTASGIAADTGGSISGCNAYFNRANGIEFGSYSDIRANNASDNTAAGLQTAGNFSRVDVNQSTGNAVGIALDGSENVVHRNNLYPDPLRWTGSENDYVVWDGSEPWNNIY